MGFFNGHHYDGWKNVIYLIVALIYIALIMNKPEQFYMFIDLHFFPMNYLLEGLNLY